MALSLALSWLAACPGASSVPSSTQRERAQPAVTALQAGSFVEARRLADQALAEDGHNGHAAAVRAIVGFQAAMHDLREQTMLVLDSASSTDGFDHARMRAALERTVKALAAADADLVVAARDQRFSLELCLACWERDWNHSGEVDRNDRRLFQIEINENGDYLPEGDPRRTPTFHFDVGDVHWARAMLSFQRAFLEMLLAYRWTELDRLVGSLFRGSPPLITIHLDHPERIARARALILDGLEHADRCRRAYLAETDDDREWVPNPRQRNHPLPLPVDDQLYQVWAGILGDVERLIAGKEALSVADLAQLGDDRWDNPPGGYIDIARMLSAPRNIVLDLPALERKWDRPERTKADRKALVEDTLVSVLGDYYDRTGARKASPLIQRLARMKREMDRGEDTFERKLRYLLWLN